MNRAVDSLGSRVDLLIETPVELADRVVDVAARPASGSVTDSPAQADPIPPAAGLVRPQFVDIPVKDLDRSDVLAGIGEVDRIDIDTDGARIIHHARGRLLMWPDQTVKVSTRQVAS